METFFNNIKIINLIFKWKWHLIILIIIAMLLAVLFSSSLFITPLYKSSAIIYPSNTSPYSDESETEQMLQILQARDIRDSIINEFDLYKHYEINPEGKKHYSYMVYEYGEKVLIGKTPYEAVSIEVLDKDPFIACDMVNAIIDFYNLKVRRLHNKKFSEVVKMYKKAMDGKKEYIDSLEVIIHKMNNEYGLIDYGSQSREVARGFLGTVDGSNSAQINKKEVLKLKKNIENVGSEFILLNNLFHQETSKYIEAKMEYDISVMNLNRNYTYANVITAPYGADKKAYPVRWIIVALTALATFFFATIIISIIENLKISNKNT